MSAILDCFDAGEIDPLVESSLAAGEILTLRDGREVQIRPVRPQDFELEQSFFEHLHPQTRRRRFHLGVNLLPAQLLHDFTEIDYQSHYALVAETVGDDEPALVADARYVVRSEDCSAEFALVVADDWQRIGLGRALLARLGQRARASGVRMMAGEVLRDNQPMLALARKLGARIVPHRVNASLETARWSW